MNKGTQFLCMYSSKNKTISYGYFLNECVDNWVLFHFLSLFLGYCNLFWPQYTKGQWLTKASVKFAVWETNE